ncbi:MAG: hypothetical protein AB4050_06985 [Synechococcus sp.]
MNILASNTLAISLLASIDIGHIQIQSPHDLRSPYSPELLHYCPPIQHANTLDFVRQQATNCEQST